MRPLTIALAALVLTAACADLTSETTGGNSSGGPPQFCPDAADSYALANGLPLPYPANPANPTPYSPSLPPPYFFHPCLNAAGAPTYRNGMPCLVCTDSTDQYPQLLPGSLVCTDAMPDGTPVVCVGSLRAGDVTECDPGLQGCQ
jgi:hypothetical protein